MVIGARVIHAVLASCMVRAWIKSGHRCKVYPCSASLMHGACMD